MKAIKANKAYTINEVSKEAYLSQGFDIANDEGKIIEHSPSGNVSREEYDRVLSELESLKSTKKVPDKKG